MKRSQRFAFFAHERGFSALDACRSPGYFCTNCHSVCWTIHVLGSSRACLSVYLFYRKKPALFCSDFSEESEAFLLKLRLMYFQILQCYVVCFIALILSRMISSAGQNCCLPATGHCVKLYDWPTERWQNFFCVPWYRTIFTACVQKVLVWRSVYVAHRCSSRQIFEIFRGAKDFCPNFPNLSEKNPKNDLQKKRLHFISCWAHFVKSSDCKQTFLPKFQPNLIKFPLTCPRNMTSK